jgi:hypothetical protein
MGEREKYNLALLACALQPFFTSVYRYFLLLLLLPLRVSDREIGLGLGAIGCIFPFFQKRENLSLHLSISFFISFYFILRTNNNRKKPTET